MDILDKINSSLFDKIAVDLNVDRTNDDQCLRVVEQLTVNQIQQITALNLSNSRLTQVDVLIRCTFLNKLYLEFSDVSSIQGISECSNLEILNLSFTHVKDLKPIKKCLLLQGLWLDHTQAEDLAPLKNCNQLRLLDLSRTLVKDLTVLQNCSKLEILGLGGSKVVDIKPLINMQQLTSLELMNPLEEDLFIANSEHMRSFYNIEEIANEILDSILYYPGTVKNQLHKWQYLFISSLHADDFLKFDKPSNIEIFKTLIKIINDRVKNLKNKIYTYMLSLKTKQPNLYVIAPECIFKEEVNNKYLSLHFLAEVKHITQDELSACERSSMVDII